MILLYLNFLELKMREMFPDFVNNKDGHDLSHFYRVANHSIYSLFENDLNQLDPILKEDIVLASFLHDIDDEKFHKSENFSNARNLLEKVKTNFGNIFEHKFEEFTSSNNSLKISRISRIIEMISLVSCSKNGDNEVPIYYMIIPRMCDRLDAIGYIGLLRCYEYTIAVNRPFHVNDTLIIKNEKDFNSFEDRYQRYLSGVKSNSMIDHFYDRLLHITFPCNNNYILNKAEKEKNILKEFLIKYWEKFEFEAPTKIKVLNIIKEFNK